MLTEMVIGRNHHWKKYEMSSSKYYGRTEKSQRNVGFLGIS